MSNKEDLALRTPLPQPKAMEAPVHASRPGNDPPPGSGRTIFLHTGWRSRGTWIWSRCREQPGVVAFYEPLHEHLARLGAAEIRTLRPGSWASSHSETTPYFQEFGRLLPPGGRGVPLYLPRFAFHDFFLAPGDNDDPLEDYMRSLAAATGPERAGVFKFCRSLGRVGWLERRFPHALHAVILRDPVSQWASAQALLTRQRNRYFSVAPLMVLARNARHTLVEQATAALQVRLPDLHSDDLAYATETCWWHLKRLDEAARYRQYLAFWCATAVAALDSTALTLDAGRLAGDDAYRSEIEAAFGPAIGPMGFAARAGAAQPRPPTLPATPPKAADQAEAHSIARALVRQLGAALAPERLDTILALLPSTQPDTRSLHQVRIHQTPDQRRPPARLTIWATILAARALQPLRRLHGAWASRQDSSF